MGDDDDQGDLFSYRGDTPEQRARVYAKIAPVVLSYAHDNAGLEFHADDLLHFVLERVPDIAPDSPGRILRELRIEKKLDYVVLNRRQSLYQFVGAPV